MLKIKNKFIVKLNEIGECRYNIEHIREDSCAVWIDNIHIEYNPVIEKCYLEGEEMGNINELFEYIYRELEHK